VNPEKGILEGKVLTLLGKQTEKKHGKWWCHERRNVDAAKCGRSKAITKTNGTA